MDLDYIMVCPAPSAVLGVFCLSQGPKAFQGPKCPSLPRACLLALVGVAYLVLRTYPFIDKNDPTVQP